MIEGEREADSEPVGRTLCDIAQVLESAQAAGERVRGALDLLGKLVPYQQCALLEAEAGFDPRLVALPDMPPGEESELTEALIKLFGKMLEERALAPGPSPLLWGVHLAVPLIGLDEVIGVLFVRRREGTYEKRHLRVLSVVAAHLAGYLMMLRARAKETGRIQELEDARRALESALRAKDQLLNLVADEMRTPLAAAMAWVRILGSRDLTRDERARAVEAIEHSVRTQTRLVGDLLDLGPRRPARKCVQAHARRRPRPGPPRGRRCRRADPRGRQRKRVRSRPPTAHVRMPRAAGEPDYPAQRRLRDRAGDRKARGRNARGEHPRGEPGRGQRHDLHGGAPAVTAGARAARRKIFVTSIAATRGQR